MKRSSLLYDPGLLFFLLFLTACHPFRTESDLSAPAASSSRSVSSLTEEETLEAFQDICRRFFEETVTQDYLTLRFTLQDPEAFGISSIPVTFGPISSESLKEEIRYEKETLQQLQELDPSRLSGKDQITWEVLTESLSRDLAFEGPELYYEPLLPTVGIQVELPVLLSEFSFYTEGDIEDYLTLLSDYDAYCSRLLAFEQEKAEAGLFMADSQVDQILQECEAYLVRPEEHLLAESFSARLQEISWLTGEEKASLQEQNLDLLREHVLPGYQLLTEGLRDLKGSACTEGGLCSLPQGKDYFTDLVFSKTGSSCSSVRELEEKIQKQLEKDSKETAELLRKDADLLTAYADYQYPETDPYTVLSLLESSLQDHFPACALPDLQFTDVPQALEDALSPALFLEPPLDRTAEAVIYLNRGNENFVRSVWTVLAHEGYPGHLYQKAYFRSTDPDPVRMVINCDGYTEGWGIYAESFVPLVDTGLSEELNRLLQADNACTLGLHALLSLYIHADGWSEAQIASFLAKHYEIRDTETVRRLYQALLANPVGYLSYYVGYLEFLEMRKEAESILKDRFSESDFHRYLLEFGPAPFPVIRRHLREGLEAFSLTDSSPAP